MANITSGGKVFFWGDYPMTVDGFRATAAVSALSSKMLYSDVNGDQRDGFEYVKNPFTGSAQQNFYSPGSTTTPYIKWYGNYSGNYKVSGLVEINTVVVEGKWVFIFPENAPSLCIGSQYTSSNGQFTFNYLAPGKYKVYAMDPNFNYNGKLYENISAVAM